MRLSRDNDGYRSDKRMMSMAGGGPREDVRALPRPVRLPVTEGHPVLLKDCCCQALVRNHQ